MGLSLIIPSAGVFSISVPQRKLEGCGIIKEACVGRGES